MKELLLTLQHDNKIRALDYRFALLMQEQSVQLSLCESEGKSEGAIEGESEALLLASALVSFELGKGNVCIDINRLDKPFDLPEHQQAITRELKNSKTQLLRSGVVGEPGDKRPLIMDGDLLYLNRYWCYEMEVAEAIKKRLGNNQLMEEPALKTILSRLFASSAANTDKEPGAQQTDWQKIAAALAIRDNFSVITGGPGTGKTTTVTRLLALLLELAEHQGLPHPLIKLVAPTGKAAARLSESVKGAKQALNCSDTIKDSIQDEASTIHRLLSVVPNSPHFRHNKLNPLLIDVLVVDEASMVDLPLMAKLLESLPDTCRVILLGDKDQLSSVEAGSVLGDICGGDQRSGYSETLVQYISDICDCSLKDSGTKGVPAIADSIAHLRESHRFEGNSGIKKLADAVNGGDVQESENILKGTYEDIQFVPSAEHSYRHLIEQALEGYRHFLGLVQGGADPQEIINAFSQFQVLCALRKGDYGVQLINARIEQALFQKGLIHKGLSTGSANEQWYVGRPVMVTENDYGVGLYNGDIGITIKDSEDGQLRVLFIMPDGTQRHLSPSRLPTHETVYAMTVHKSQGSEFDQVVMVLPDTYSPLLSRELFYTGITRARKLFVLYAPMALVSKAVTSPTLRISGLKNRLWN